MLASFNEAMAEIRRHRPAWIVMFVPEALLDFEAVKSRRERKATFNAVRKLTELGPDLPSPHVKSLKGETDLFELRPNQGRIPVRPIYCRYGDEFLILAIAPNKGAFDRAVADAKDRKRTYVR